MYGLIRGGTSSHGCPQYCADLLLLRLGILQYGLAVTLEVGRGSDEQLRYALRPLALFGFFHGAHEWLEMFQILGILPGQDTAPLAWQSIRIVLLAFSFLSLAVFGSALLAPTRQFRRVALFGPLLLSAIWGFGVLALRGKYPVSSELWVVADVWSRYVLAIPSALLACAGLIRQQREFRRVGLERFGQDTLWAAVAFAWYGLVGQIFVASSPLPPSNVVNSTLFFKLFGFPIQLLRATVAIIGALFVIRFLRASEVETQRHIVQLQEERLREAERQDKCASNERANSHTTASTIYCWIKIPKSAIIPIF